ncbi:MAG: recombinase family protein [Oscillospiraceae bacterium]|nr:recombinase family protein [Oscillospiraceae bacterium]
MQAIYARQSVDKKDSISIESQIEECKKKINKNESYEIFSDKGYSGKSVKNRPEFQRMMTEVKQGNVSRIIIYKYDRISRSLYDFINMQREFEKYNTDLVSVNEQFDTSTTQGKAMVSILMTFAEMERETIQQRVEDNYYSRGEKGFYLGGYAPFGYEKIETQLNGKKTYTFKIKKDESRILEKMYKDYLNGMSLNAIARELNEKKVPTRQNRPWSSNAVSRMLKSPIHVKANADIYNYLLGIGATMNNSIEDYKGVKGCYVYGKVSKRKGSKFVNLKNDYVTLGLHDGIIDADVWLSVRNIFAQRKGHSNIGTGSLTWLQGLMKCGCGYNYYIKKYKARSKNNKTVYRYLYCRGRRYKTCPHSKKMVPVETIENIVKEALFKRLNELKEIKQSSVVKDSPEINELKIELSKTDEEIKNLLSAVAKGNSITIEYINQRIVELDREKNEILEEITRLQLEEQNGNADKLDIENIIKDWDNYNTEIKKQIAKAVIKVIEIADGKVDIKFF